MAVHERIVAITADRRFTRPDGSAIPDEQQHRRSLRQTVFEHEQNQIRTRLEAITERTWSWQDEQAEAIRPLWRGERFDVGYVVATLFTQRAA